MSYPRTRRDFIRDFGIGAAALPFLLNLPSFAVAETMRRKKQRLIVMFSPNGVFPPAFWPDAEGDKFEFKEILKPLEPFKAKTLVLNGVCDKVRGDGDNHMRGIGCLLTGTELYPGNIQGGSHTPAGWASGISIDQEIKNFLQKDKATRTRFGSLEFGVMVPDRADTWTRMVYAGPNKPIAPLDDPHQMFAKLYGRRKDQENLRSVLDELKDDLKKVAAAVPAADRQILDEHATFVREMEQELAQQTADVGHALPEPEPGVRRDNDNMPKLSKTQIDLMVNSFAADFARVATFQITNSVGRRGCAGSRSTRATTSFPIIPTATRRRSKSSSRSTPGIASNSPISPSASPKLPNPAAMAICSTTRRSSGRTNSARATPTRSTTSRSWSSAVDWAGSWGDR